MRDVLIIGGGSSGVVSAIFAKKKGYNVTIIERNNTLLKKLLMTGNGKCNYYNSNQDLSNYHSSNSELLDRVICEDNLSLVTSFFENLGVVPKIKNGYYYPYSGQASTIKNVLVGEVERLGIKVIYNSLVTNIKKESDKFFVEYKCDDKKSILTCTDLVVSTGSFAYPKTGSDGMGYSFLEKMGHTIIKPLPALVQLVSDFKYCKEWAGVRSDVCVSFIENDNLIASESGEIQFTDYGVSGICIFNLSHFVTRSLDLGRKCVISINFVPFVEGNVSDWFNNHCSNLFNLNIKGILEGFLNNKIVSIILKMLGIDGDLYYDDLTVWEIEKIIELISCFKISICDTKGFDMSQVCNGGVKITDVNLFSFESLKVPNLYITGELLDINGNCGGYNLTNCFISGIIAGKSIGEDND